MRKAPLTNVDVKRRRFRACCGAARAPMIQVTSVNVARASLRLIGTKQVLTAIGKQPVSGPVEVRTLGLAGDEQADLSVHGGLSKAVYAYPHEHYAFWQVVRAQARVAAWDEALAPGAMGENLGLRGLLEGDMWVGDFLQSAPLHPGHQRAAPALFQVQRGDGLQPGRQADAAIGLLRRVPDGDRARHGAGRRRGQPAAGAARGQPAGTVPLTPALGPAGSQPRTPGSRCTRPRRRHTASSGRARPAAGRRAGVAPGPGC